MTSAGVPGARESSAGDEFHVLWAVRRVLALLDSTSGLERVMMEDLTPVPPEGIDPELLLAADMAEYYGGTELTSAARVVVSQLKYSHRHPERSWTAARLAQSGPRGQKGVIARLADLYQGVSETGERGAVLARLEIRLVSNMPCGVGLAAAVRAAKSWLAERPDRARRADLLGGVGQSARSDLVRLSDASGLGSYAFTDFLRVLDLSYTGADSRAEQELAITHLLAEHVLDDLRHASLAIADLVRRRALPEGAGAPIERSHLLAALEVHSERDLLPAPPRFTPPAHPVRTPDAARILAALDAAQGRRVLAHGPAGVGKTTAILALERELPPGSVVLTYDCFGDGDYETPGAGRHEGLRFGVQVCNELAVRCRLPVLIRPPRSAHDLWGELERRLRAAGELLGGQGARLVLVVDAADNGAWAGRRFGEDTFLRYLWAQPIPEGTGLIVTCRSGRRDLVEPPPGIAQVELRGFDEAASAAYLRTRFPDAGDAEARAFHARSAGNPRVQFYVLFQARAGAAADLTDAVAQAQLTPDDIFQSLLDAAVARAPAADEAQARLAELVCLTKPLTSDRFRVVSGLAAERVRAFCESLVPGVVIEGDVIAFRDEDFANFLREQVGAEEEAAAHSRLADLFLGQHRDPYAALVVADHLHNAGRGGDLVALALTDGAPEAIADPLARQQAHRRRLTLALRHAADETDRAAACQLVLLGADAARQNQAVAEILRRRPDLGMRYGDPEAVMRVYSAAENPGWRGPVHMQLAAFYARGGDHDRARAEGRQAHAWLLRWIEEEHRDWDVEADDLAAYAEAFFHVYGPDEAEGELRGWRPPGFAAQAAVALVRRLALSVPSQDLGALIAGRDLPAALRARLLAAAFGAGAPAQAEHVAAVTELLVSAPPELAPSDGWWAASVVELAAVAGLGAERVLELADAVQLPQPRSAPHRYERLGRFRDVLRLAVLRAACANRELNLDELMPLSVTDPPDDPGRGSDVEAEQRAMHENVGRYLKIFASRARALLRRPEVAELRSEWEKWIASQLRGSEHRWEPDFGYRMWLAAFTDALLACEGVDVELIRDAAAAASAIAGASDHACWMTVARRLVHDPRYRDEGLRLLERAAVLAEQAEWPASEQADALLAACAIVDPVDFAHARDLHGRAVAAAEGMDDDGIGRLELHARVAAGLVGAPAVAELAWRTGQTLVAHRRRVSDEDRLPWSATLRAISLLHPQTGLALVGRWEDAGHQLLHRTIPVAMPALAEAGFLTPAEALALLALAGEDTNPISAATALLERIPPGPARAAALAELSLRIRRDLLPDTRAGAAQSLLEWAAGEGLADADAVRALEPVLASTEERSGSRPWAASVASERDEREQAADAIVARAANGDPAAVDGDLRELARLFAGQRIATYLDAVTNAVIPSRRAELMDALAAVPTDHPVANFHADDILNTLVHAAAEWNGSAALRARCAEAIARVLETHFEAMTRYAGEAERLVAKVLTVGGLEDPAGLVLRVAGASLERLSPAALYGTASELALGLGREERAGFLSWSLNGLQSEPVAVPELPAERADVLAGLFWSLFAAPDKTTRWRAAHATRTLITAGDEALVGALFACTKRRGGGAFGAPERHFYWHSAQVWALMVIARAARDAPGRVAALAPELAAVACDRDWPHAGVREFARRAALRIAEVNLDAVPPQVVDELRIANSPRKCKREREPYYYRTGRDSRDYETQRFHFGSMDTLPYVYGPFGARFGLDVDEVCQRAERWIVDRMGLSDERVRDERVDRMDYSLRDDHHGGSPRVESWHHALERHALQLVAGELCDEGVSIVGDSGEDPPDPWAEWLREYLDSMEHGWIVDERGPVPPVPALLMTDVGRDDWPELTYNELERAIGMPEPESLVVEASVQFSADFGYGSTYVASALVSPGTAPALVRALEAAEDDRAFALPVEHGYWREEEADIDQGEFRLQGWLWEDYHEKEGLEKHDPLGRIGLSVTRPGSAFLAVCGGTLDAAGWGVRGPAGGLLAWQRTWSDTPSNGLGRREPQGTSGRETHVRRDALCELLRATDSLLIVQASAARHRSGRHYREEESSEQRIHKVYLFGPDGRLATVDGPIETR